MPTKKLTVVNNEEPAPETPPDVTGYGGVIFDASGTQQPSNGGMPIISEERQSTILNAMEIAATVTTIQKQFRINPQVGIQIVHLAMQAAAQETQMQNFANEPEEPADG